MEDVEWGFDTLQSCLETLSGASTAYSGEKDEAMGDFVTPHCHTPSLLHQIAMAPVPAVPSRLFPHRSK